MSYALRPATEADLAFAFGLYRDLMHDPTVELLQRWNEEGQRSTVASGIASGAVQIVQVDGAEVGWVQVKVDDEGFELGQLYLERAWQGRGLGSALVAAVKRRARDAGKPVRLSVIHNNPRARALYERLGFVEVHRDPYKTHMRWSPPPLAVVEGTFAELLLHAAIPIAFQVERLLDVELIHGGLGGLALRDRPVDVPYLKDYDAIEGNHPLELPGQFDLANWGLLAAMSDGQRVGGAIIAFDTPRVHLLGSRRDRAVLWDLRVAPTHRGRGVGTALFAAAVAWARDRGCRQLAVETQNINLAACRFYAARGCELGAIHRFAYPDLPDEVQLLWFKPLR
jgi:GNAT superfamily N-acetyltransferase